MHSRALGDGLVLRYFYDGCDNSVLRGFLPTHTQVQVKACVNYNNAKQPVTVLYFIFLSGHDEL